MQYNKIVIPYIIKGMLIGVFFPVFAFFICVNFLYPKEYSYTLASVHEDFPLMWIIDTAPFVLGVISYFVGTSINKLNSSFLAEIKVINKELILKNNEQDTLIKEKEVLLKEVHHRVKNNLQVITSLLNLQGRHIEDPDFKKLLKNCQNRIQSMSILHEMLYQSQSISKIKYEDYIQKLISTLIVSMKGETNNIALTLEVHEIRLGINTLIPLGLLINEVITNSLKYGIPGDLPGELSLKMTKNDDDTFKIIVGDDGVGFTDDINFNASKTLGLRLIKKLTRQLNGSIEKIKKGKGTYYVLIFQEQE